MTRRTCKKRRCSKGNVNRIIDSALHPLFDQNSAFIAVDAVLHGLVEQNPPETIKKFVRYTMPEIVKRLFKSS